MTIRSLKTMIRCRDLSASRAFYVDMLGLEVVEEWDEPEDQGLIVQFGSGNGFLEMLSVDPVHSHHDPGFSDVVANDKLEFQIHVESVSDWAEVLLDKGIEIEGPTSRPWGNTYLWMRDPDGVQVALYQPTS